MKIPNPHNHNGRARVRVPGQYRHLYLGEWGSEEAAENYRRYVAELLAGQSPRLRGRCSVSLLVARYMEHTMKRRRDLSSLRSTLEKLVQLYGADETDELGPLKITAVLCHFGHQRRRTLLGRAGYIVQMLRWGVSQELVDPATWQAAKSIRIPQAGESFGLGTVKPNKDIKPVPFTEVKEILPFCSKSLGDYLRVLYLLGCRPGELLAMRAEEIDRAGPGDCWVYSPAQHKTKHKGHKRHILVGPEAQAILAPRLIRGGYIFPAKHGGKNTLVAIRVSIKLACRKAGVEQFHPNQLRHTRLDEIRKAYGAETTQAVAGHASMNTQQFYVERDIELAANIMAEIG